MAMNNQDRKWVGDQIEGRIRAISAVAETDGWRKAALRVRELAKAITPLATILVLAGLLLTAIVFAVDQHSAATHRAVEEATFVEHMRGMETSTTSRLSKIEDRLDKIDLTLANLTIAVSNSRPMSAQSASSLAQVLRSATERKQTLEPALVKEAGDQLVSSPNITGVWKAAADLIAYRYSSVSSKMNVPLPDCYSIVLPPNEDHLNITDPTTGKSSLQIQHGFMPDLGSNWQSHVYLNNCVLSIDDRPDFAETSIGRYFSQVQAHHPNLSKTTLVLTNVRVTYSGGAVLPVTQIECNDCVFDLKLSAPPPPRNLLKFA